MDVMNLIINDYQVNLDKTINKFNYQSVKSISSQKHNLETIKHP